MASQIYNSLSKHVPTVRLRKLRPVGHCAGRPRPWEFLNIGVSVGWVVQSRLPNHAAQGFSLPLRQCFQHVHAEPRRCSSPWNPLTSPAMTLMQTGGFIHPSRPERDCEALAAGRSRTKGFSSANRYCASLDAAAESSEVHGSASRKPSRSPQRIRPGAIDARSRRPAEPKGFPATPA